MTKKRIQLILILLGVCVIFLVGYRLYIEYQQDLQLFLNPQVSREELMKTIRSHGIFAAILLIILTSAMCAVPGIPTSVVGVLVGVSYGPVLGTLINVIGNALGNIFAVFLMSHLKFLDKSRESNRWVRAIKRMRHPKIGVLLGYMIPIIPSSIVNFTAYSLKLPLHEILLSIIFGVIPSSVLYACGGQALFHGYSKTALVIVASVLIFSGLILVIYKDRKKHPSILKKNNQ